MVPSRAVPFAAFAAALIVLPAAAQTVAGTLAEPGGQAVEQVLVALVDSAGVQRAAAFTDAAGAFTIHAPQPGRYSLRAERIGYATVTSPPFDLRDGETRTERLTASDRSVMLQALRVSAAGRRCSGRVDRALETAMLWEEARKALNAAAYAESARLFRYDVVRWSRDLDAREGTILRDTRRTWSDEARHPFVSAPPEELSRRGFIRAAEADSTEYWAPDANVMLSEQFLNDHCFRVVASADPALVGLAFEPVRGRAVPDLAGTLWLNRATAELRRVEYRYVGGPPESETPGVGGTVEYARLPGGPWIVRRWAIRMPLTQRRPGYTTVDNVVTRYGAERAVNLAVVRESGGQVTRTSAGLAVGPAPVIEGVVWDSTRGAPLAGARVYLSGTQAEAVAGADGRYRLQAPAAGTYTIGFTHPELGPLAAAISTRTVAVADGGAAVELAVPGSPAVRRALCADSMLERQPGIVYGRVHGPHDDSTLVVASWQDIMVTSRVSSREESVATRPDAQGDYVLCGVPEGRVLRVWVRQRRVDAGSLQVSLADDTPVRQDVSADRRAVADLSALQALAAAAGVPVREVGREGFERRRQTGRGIFLAREEVERRRAERLGELFRGIAGVQVVRDRSGERVMLSAAEVAAGSDDMRGGGSVSRGSIPVVGAPSASQPRMRDAQLCAARYYVDGVPAPRLPGHVQPGDVDAVEIYRTAAEVPPEFRRGDSRCGVIVLWTRRSAPAP